MMVKPLGKYYETGNVFQKLIKMDQKKTCGN
jgi:hypothetical protein